MCDSFNNVVVKARRCLGITVLYLSVVLCFAFSGPQCLAQELKLLSKDRKAPIVQTFYPEKNETAIIAPIGAVEDSEMLGMSRLGLPHRSYFTLSLESAEYAYLGKIPTRPKSVSFTFFVNRNKDRFKENPNFSISVDNKVIKQGEYVLEQRTFEENKKPVTRDVLAITVPTDVFLSIAPAKKVSFKIGPETHKLNSEQRKHLNALAKSMSR